MPNGTIRTPNGGNSESQRANLEAGALEWTKGRTSSADGNHAPEPQRLDDPGEDDGPAEQFGARGGPVRRVRRDQALENLVL